MAGTIVDKGNGKYKISYMYQSERYYETIEVSSMTEARLILAQFVLDIRNGFYLKPCRLTFQEFSNIFLKDYAIIALGYESQLKTRNTLIQWILPKMGKYKMCDLTPQMWSSYISWLSDQISPRTNKKLAETTVERYLSIIRSIYSFALKNGYIKNDVFAKARMKNKKTIENLNRKKLAHIKERCLTYDEAYKLIDALNSLDLKYQLIVHFAIAGGLRRSEILGLKWEDINFEKNMVTISQSSLQIRNVGYIEGDLKNTYSHRNIYMPQTTMDLLKQYKEETAEYTIEKEFVFVNNRGCRKGLRLCPATITRWFRTFRESINLPPEVPLHGLRHTSATILITQGVNIKSVSRRLGHSSARTTLDVYSHTLTEIDAEATDNLEEFLFEGIEELYLPAPKRYKSPIKLSKLIKSKVN